jgi:hypothetical protein
MKRVDDMTMEEMDRYFKRMDRIFHTIGSSYRIIWPFEVFSPLSPMRLVLNLGVILTWLTLIIWALTDLDSTASLEEGIFEIWIVTLPLAIIVGFFERHYRIKIRYHQLKSARRFHRMVPPIFGGQRPRSQNQHTPNNQSHDKRKDQGQNRDRNPPKADHPPSGIPAQGAAQERPSEVKTGEIIQPSDDDNDLLEIGLGILRKVFR